jgi:hypothetical protein
VEQANQELEDSLLTIEGTLFQGSDVILVSLVLDKNHHLVICKKKTAEVVRLEEYSSEHYICT